MDDMLDFQEEAKWCLNLAEAETHPEVRTLLMGMVVGWPRCLGVMTFM